MKLGVLSVHPKSTGTSVLFFEVLEDKLFAFLSDASGSQQGMKHVSENDMLHLRDMVCGIPCQKTGYCVLLYITCTWTGKRAFLDLKSICPCCLVDKGVLRAFKGQLIHTFNKREGALLHAAHLTELQGRPNVLLLGDSLGDLTMADGVAQPQHILTVGYLNDQVSAQGRIEVKERNTQGKSIRHLHYQHTMSYCSRPKSSNPVKKWRLELIVKCVGVFFLVPNMDPLLTAGWYDGIDWSIEVSQQWNKHIEL